MKEECWKSWYWDNYAQMKLITTNGKDTTTMETASINQCPAPTAQTQPRTALPSSAWDVMSRSKVFKLSVSAAVLAGPSFRGAVMFGRTQIFFSVKSPMSILKLHGLCKNASLRCDKNQCHELWWAMYICNYMYTYQGLLPFMLAFPCTETSHL